MKIIGGKWKPLVLKNLDGKVLRFGELQRLIPDVSKQMLTQALRELQSDGIIKRKIYAKIPPKVEYRLTPKGESLKPVLLAMEEWEMKKNTMASSKG